MADGFGRWLGGLLKVCGDGLAVCPRVRFAGRTGILPAGWYWGTINPIAKTQMGIPG